VDVEAELTELLQSWGRAIVANDAGEISQFAADEWVLVGSGGVVERAQFLSAVQSGALTHESFETDVKQVRVYGDTAVVIAHVMNTGTWNGAAFTSDEWTTDVYLKQEGGWKCVLTQLTPRNGPS
jgi:ketosteroid isomerase-like protein